MNGDSGRLLADIGISSSYKWGSQEFFIVRCKIQWNATPISGVITMGIMG